MSNIWKTIPTPSERYELCLETREVRSKLTNKILKPYYKKWKNSTSHTYQLIADKIGWRIEVIIDKTYPYHWIEQLGDGEEATAVRGYPQFYVTTYGRVYSRKTHQFVLGQRQGNYYHSVMLSAPDGSMRRRRCIHQLVGRHFIPEWREGLCVLHRDETLPYPQINALSNLWVGTQMDNVKDMYDKGRDNSFYSRKYKPKMHIGK